MSTHRENELRARALSLLAERDDAMDLTIVRVATDVVPSSKTRIFQF